MFWFSDLTNAHFSDQNCRWDIHWQDMLSLCYTHIYTHTQNTHTYIYTHVYIMHMYTHVCMHTVVHSLSHVWLFATPWTSARQASLSFSISRSLLKLVSTESWCHPTILYSVVPYSSCPQFFPASGSFPMSQLFALGGQTFSFSISPSNECSGVDFL